MPTRHTTPPHDGESRHRARVAHHHLARTVLCSALGVVLALGTAAGTVYWQLAGRVTVFRTDLQLENRPSSRASTAPVQDARDPFGGRTVNLLLIGSDTREGENASLAQDGNVGGMRSDATTIAHISADRNRAVFASIPRDTLVDIPPCLMSNGRKTAPSRAKFNAAFAFGAAQGEDLGDAAACAQQTVETVTGIRIDGWVVLDFAGFKAMVDALGGVKLCVDRDMASANARLDIAAGCHKIDGKTALAFARARTGKGMPEGSDLARIKRQQQLMAAIMDKALGSSLLSDFPELLRFAQATLDSAAFSDALGSVTALAGFALSMRSIPVGDIEFATAPHVDAGDGANVLFAPDAQEFFDALAEDRPLPAAPSPSTR